VGSPDCHKVHSQGGEVEGRREEKREEGGREEIGKRQKKRVLGWPKLK